MNNELVRTKLVDPYAAERAKLTQRYNSSRANLLFVVAFSLINLLILIFGGNSYFLFSACLPYSIGDLAMLLCGKYPEEFYVLNGMSDMEFFGNGVFAILVVAALVGIALYFLAWIFSKKHGIGWMIFSLVMFVLDTVFMFAWYVISADMIMDIVFHAWVLISLTMGIVSYFKLKKLPEPQVVEIDPETEE